MNAASLVEIPDDLAAEAAAVPGLPERLLSFLRAEVSLYKRRQGQHTVQAREIVQQAQEEAARLKASGMTPAAAKQHFAKLYVEIMDTIAAKP